METLQWLTGHVTVRTPLVSSGSCSGEVSHRDHSLTSTGGACSQAGSHKPPELSKCPREGDGLASGSFTVKCT